MPEPRRIPWALIPSMGAAGILVGASCVPVGSLLYGPDFPRNFWSVRYIMLCTFIFGLCAALCGTSLALFPRLWQRLIAAPTLTYSGFLFVGLCVDGPSWFDYAVLPLDYLLAVCGPALALTLVDSGLLVLHERQRLGVVGPYATLIVGAFVGAATPVFMAPHTPISVGAAIGALAGLATYYSLVAALAFHGGRHRRSG